MVVMCACVWGGRGHTTCAVDPLAQREALPGGCKVAALPPGDSTPLPQAQAWRGVYWQGGGGVEGGSGLGPGPHFCWLSVKFLETVSSPMQTLKFPGNFREICHFFLSERGRT